MNKDFNKAIYTRNRPNINTGENRLQKNEITYKNQKYMYP